MNTIQSRTASSLDRSFPPSLPQLQEEKRRALVLKAKADRLKKKADMKHIQRAILTQRKIAQRQRRERERQMMRQARERQDKVVKQREVEVCGV